MIRTLTESNEEDHLVVGEFIVLHNKPGSDQSNNELILLYWDYFYKNKIILQNLIVNLKKHPEAPKINPLYMYIYGGICGCVNKSFFFFFFLIPTNNLSS